MAAIWGNHVFDDRQRRVSIEHGRQFSLRRKADAD